jgi:DNA helicase-2/ATP-dependent DNA helicase PcrA
MEEERRLCYVGITRAKERLYLVYAFRRTLYGENQVSIPSRFIKEIPSHLIELSPSGEMGVVRLPRRVMIPSFNIGERVSHPIFGEGIVVESKLIGGDEEVTVAFEKAGMRRLLVGLARLERLD